MLGKLLKYDLRYVYKVLSAYYIITIVSVICGVLIQQISEPPFIIEFIGEFLTNAGIGLSIGLIINAFTRTWVRFRQSLYGDESYLTHTLPISRLQLFTSKFISAIIVLLLSIVVIAAVLFLVFREQLTGLDLFATIPDSSLTLFYVASVLLLLFIVQSIFIIMCGFTGIVVGHRFDTARGIISAVAGIGCYLATAALLVGIIFFFSSINPQLGDLIAYGKQPDLQTLIDCSWICIVTYATITATMFFVNVKLLNRGVNVE